MDLETFHKKLLGQNPKRTPKEYLLTKKQQALYAAVEESDRRGFLALGANRQNFEKFLGTFVLAYHMTTFPTKGDVYIVVSRIVEKWAVEQLKTIIRHIYHERKGASKETFDVIDDAINRMHVGSGSNQIDDEPDRWVAFGYNNLDVLPPWMRGRLIR